MKSDRRGKPAASGARHAQAAQRVRIIGGLWKRTPLPVADAPGLRPTPDRVRETLFNWIAHLRPDVAALRGLDVFAGTGALGFELASRGAAQVLLVERSAAVAAQLRAIRDRLAAAQVEVRQGEATAVLRELARRGERFDLVFIDPPFDAGLHAPALAASMPLLADRGLVYVESDRPLHALAAAQALAPVRELKAGQVHAALYARASSPPGDEATDAGAGPAVESAPVTGGTHLPPPSDH